ncbi:MAG: sodium:calcium antiporter [Methanocellales archaeon]
MLDIIYLLLLITLIISGLLILNEGSNLISDNATIVARRAGSSRFAISILLVSTLASMPETLVSLFALQENSIDIAMANALVSIIVNISFIIGLSALIMPLRTTKVMVARDAVFLLTMTIIASALLLDGILSRLDGFVLLLLYLPYSINLWIAEKTMGKEETYTSLKDAFAELVLFGRIFNRGFKIRTGLMWLLAGIFLAVIGAEFLTRGSIEISRSMDISEWLIGATIVAVGTSLPDIAAAYHATRKGMTDVALGAGIGANITSILLTLGLMGLVYPLAFDIDEVLPTIIAMNVLTFTLFIFLAIGKTLTRREGIILFSFYIGIAILNIFR